MSKVLNHHADGYPPGSVSIMRPGPYGNPFIIGRDGTRDEVVDKHLEWARERMKKDEVFAKYIRSLKGKNLVCCCAPRRCHGDNLLILCNE